jgi:hypothetical protein
VSGRVGCIGEYEKNLCRSEPRRLWVVSFDEAPGAYEEYVDRNPQKSVKLGIAFV